MGGFRFSSAAEQGGLGANAILRLMGYGCCCWAPLSPSKTVKQKLEARELSKRAETPAHPTMLLHIAETWENFCAELKATQAH